MYISEYNNTQENTNTYKKLQKIMQNLSIRQLKEKLPVKYQYAERVVERAKENGLELTTKDVYNTIVGRTKIHEPTIRRILELLIQESETQLATIV